MNLASLQSGWQDVSDAASHLWLEGNSSAALEKATAAFTLQRSVITCINMAVILDSLARYDEALPYARAAYECDPSDVRAVHCYGETLLRFGQFDRGWPLYYHGRRDLDPIRQHLTEWVGQDIRGKRLLLVSYGGAGDNFYFLHAVPALKALGAKVFYACYQPIASLARRMGITPVTNSDDTSLVSLAGYDYFVPVYALGLRLGWSLENPLWSGSYIRVPFWHSFRAWPRIGVCWRAGEGTAARKTRFLSTLQVSEILCAIRNHEVDDLTGLSGDWLPTARRLAKLSLLVTVDTGLAHLAGAMGVPTWTLLPGGAAWQYPLGFEFHPFYPSMRLFWNRGEGLDDAVDSVCSALGGM